MSKTLKTRPSTGILVPTIEEVPRISESEREALEDSLEDARAEIAAGNFDAITSQSLRDEFEEMYRREEREEKITPHPSER